MVSLNTILAIGGLGAAYLIFKNLGGAAGIGSSIGGGFGGAVDFFNNGAMVAMVAVVVVQLQLETL